MNDPACRVVADASAKQMNLDKMVISYVEKQIPGTYKPPMKLLYGVNDVITNKRITFNWSFP